MRKVVFCRRSRRAARRQAQAWPAKPIRWVVPYTGGGITDVVTRVVTQKMQNPLGQPIVVDNRPGANSILAPTSSRMRRRTVTPCSRSSPPCRECNALRRQAAFRHGEELCADLAGRHRAADPDRQQQFPRQGREAADRLRRANPGKINFGSSGIGAAAHLTTELLKQTAASTWCMCRTKARRLRSRP